MHESACAAHMIKKKRKRREREKTISALFFACGSPAAPVKEEVEFRGAEAPVGFCSRSGGGDKYQAQERGRRGDFKKEGAGGSECAF